MTAKLVTFIDWTNWIYVRNAIFDCYDAITDCSPNMLLPLFVAANEEFCDRTLPLLPFPETATGSDPLPSSGAQLPQKWCKQATNLLKTSHVWSDRRLLQWWKKLSAAQAASDFSWKYGTAVSPSSPISQMDQEGKKVRVSHAATVLLILLEARLKLRLHRLGNILSAVTVSRVYSLLDLPHVPEDGARDEARKVFLGNADKLRSSGSPPPSTSLRRLLLPLYLEACSPVSHQFPPPQPA
eukprot:gene23510-24985_t